MTSTEIERSRSAVPQAPSWWAVLKSTARVHRADALIPLSTVAFIVLVALAGALLEHYR